MPGVPGNLQRLAKSLTRLCSLPGLGRVQWAAGFHPTVLDSNHTPYLNACGTRANAAKSEPHACFRPHSKTTTRNCVPIHFTYPSFHALTGSGDLNDCAGNATSRIVVMQYGLMRQTSYPYSWARKLELTWRFPYCAWGCFHALHLPLNTLIPAHKLKRPRFYLDL